MVRSNQTGNSTCFQRSAVQSVDSGVESTNDTPPPDRTIDQNQPRRLFIHQSRRDGCPVTCRHSTRLHRRGSSRSPRWYQASDGTHSRQPAAKPVRSTHHAICHAANTAARRQSRSATFRTPPARTPLAPSSPGVRRTTNAAAVTRSPPSTQIQRRIRSGVPSPPKSRTVPELGHRHQPWWWRSATMGYDVADDPDSSLGTRHLARGHVGRRRRLVPGPAGTPRRSFAAPLPFSRSMIQLHRPRAIRPHQASGQNDIWMLSLSGGGPHVSFLRSGPRRRRRQVSRP